jgi:hypothetical protein
MTATRVSSANRDNLVGKTEGQEIVLSSQNGTDQV